MDVHINPAGRDDLALTGDHLASRPENDANVRLHIGVAGLTYRGNIPVFDADIRLDNSPVVQNQGVSDYRVDSSIAARPLRLAHAVADDFAASELHLLPIGREVLLH